jgi:hypothetical protein
MVLGDIRTNLAGFIEKYLDYDDDELELGTLCSPNCMVAILRRQASAFLPVPISIVLQGIPRLHPPP